MPSNNVTVDITLPRNWLPNAIGRLDQGALEIATDIHRRAAIYAPRDSGALINSAKITRNGVGDYAITFGSGQVPYAYRRHFENYKNPSKTKYLARAGDSIARGNLLRYFT